MSAAGGGGGGGIAPENLTLASIVSVRIASCVTKYDSRRKKYTAFIIELRTHGGLVWIVERRFSQFFKLNQVRRASPCGCCGGAP